MCENFLKSYTPAGGMLQPMQLSADDLLDFADISGSQDWPPEPSPAPSSFARVLAALASPVKRRASALAQHQPPQAAPSWDDGEPMEDVKALSYESALRTHSRHKQQDPWATEALPIPNPFLEEERGPAHPIASPFLDDELPSADPFFMDSQFTSPPAAVASEGQFSSYSDLFLSPEALATSPGRPAEPIAETPILTASQIARCQSAATARNRKQASITIRLSQEECAQLKHRAAEAGLTVSAYMRSCTFEAEALRAQVKEALAQLRTPPAMAEDRSLTSAPAQPAGATAGWLTRLRPRPHSAQHSVRV